MAQVLTAAEVAKVYAQLLDNDDVRLDDDWFDVGGNSLTGLRLVAQLNHSTGVKLRLRDVVRTPSPQGLAARIEELAGAADQPGS